MARQLLIEQNIGKTTNIISKYDVIKNLNESHFLNDRKEDNKRLFVNAILQKSDIENKNGRIYPKHILDRELQRYMEEINLGNAFGEVNHPDASEVNLNNVPHRIVKFWWVDNVLYGTLELIVSKPFLETGLICCVGDDIANKIFNYNAIIGISSRGVGSLEKINGKNVVQDDFEIICWDLVHSPSTTNAYLYSEEQSETISNLENNIGNTEPEIVDTTNTNDEFIDKLVNFMNY